MSKHTKGPWAIREHWSNDEAYEVYPTHGGTEPSYGEWSAIVEVGDDSYEDEAKANAMLIAAAPEMLEMLQECHATLASVFVYGVPEGLVDKVWTLIQKAEGNDATTE